MSTTNNSSANPFDVTQKRAYHISMLGDRIAGKSVFLTAMYHQLGTMGDTSGIELTIPFDQDREFINDHLENLQTGKWVLRTRAEDIHKLTFRAGVNGRHPLTFTYTDQSGELTHKSVGGISSGDIEVVRARESFQKILQNSDVLLVAVDGAKLFKTLRTTDTELRNELLTSVAQARLVNKPTHFLITKWDILHGHMRLSEAENILMSITEFENFFRERSYTDSLTGRFIQPRIIPVSSVGLNYANPQIIDAATQQIDMKIKPLVTGIHPLNIAVPLAAAFHDYWTHRWEEISKLLEGNKSFEEIRPELTTTDQALQAGQIVFSALELGAQLWAQRAVSPERAQFLNRARQATRGVSNSFGEMAQMGQRTAWEDAERRRDKQAESNSDVDKDIATIEELQRRSAQVVGEFSRNPTGPFRLAEER